MDALKPTFESRGFDAFREWFIPVANFQPELKQYERLFQSCFYAGAAYGSDEAFKIYKELK